MNSQRNEDEITRMAQEVCNRLKIHCGVCPWSNIAPEIRKRYTDLATWIYQMIDNPAQPKLNQDT